jgi:hypothetical protein
MKAEHRVAHTCPRGRAPRIPTALFRLNSNLRCPCGRYSYRVVVTPVLSLISERRCFRAEVGAPSRYRRCMPPASGIRHDEH